MVETLVVLDDGVEGGNGQMLNLVVITGEKICVILKNVVLDGDCSIWDALESEGIG